MRQALNPFLGLAVLATAFFTEGCKPRVQVDPWSRLQNVGAVALVRCTTSDKFEQYSKIVNKKTGEASYNLIGYNDQGQVNQKVGFGSMAKLGKGLMKGGLKGLGDAAIEENRKKAYRDSMNLAVLMTYTDTLPVFIRNTLKECGWKVKKYRNVFNEIDLKLNNNKTQTAFTKARADEIVSLNGHYGYVRQEPPKKGLMKLMSNTSQLTNKYIYTLCASYTLHFRNKDGAAVSERFFVVSDDSRESDTGLPMYKPTDFEKITQSIIGDVKEFLMKKKTAASTAAPAA